MRKFVRSVALILALVTFFTVPSSAAEVGTGNHLVSVFDYATPNNEDSLSVTYYANESVTFSFPVRTPFYYVDIVFRMTGDTPTGVRYSPNGDISYNLNFLSLGNNIYRAYGNVGGYFTTKVYLDFDISSERAFLNFLSFDYASFQFTPYAETGVMTIGSSPTYTMSSSTSSVTHRWDIGNTGYYIVHLSCPDWKLYDQVSFFIYAYGPDIHSIVGRFGSFSIPVSVTYLDTSGSATDPRYSIMVTMDLTGLDRNKTDVPQIEISGNRRESDFQFYFSLLSVTGYIQSDSLSSFLYYFRNLEAKLSSLFDEMGERQDAYHADLQNWQQAHDQLLSQKFSSVLSAISSQTNSLITALNSFQTALVNKISSFQSSMESYLENLPRRIAEEIAKVFQPTEGKFEAAKDESQELAEEKLGAVYQAATVVDQIAGAFTEQAVQTSIAIPVVRIMILPDVPFEFGGWDVPIVPSGMEFLIDILKYVIDMVCTLAFLNGMKKRLEGFFGGESGAD